MTKKIKIYVLCYDDHSQDHALITYKCFEWASVLRIQSSTKELENIMYLSWFEENKDDWCGYDFVGTLSWSADKKLDLTKLDRFLSSIRDGNLENLTEADKIQFVPFLDFNILRYSMIEQTQINHHKFRYIWNTLLKNDYRYDVINSRKIPFFACNYWMASPEFLLKYCKFQKSIKRKIDENEELLHINSDSGYVGKISKERLIEIFGVPYYTYHPFVYERLIGFFLHVNRRLFVNKTTVRNA